MKSLLLSVEPPPEPYTLTAHIYTLTARKNAHIYTLTAHIYTLTAHIYTLTARKNTVSAVFFRILQSIQKNDLPPPLRATTAHSLRWYESHSRPAAAATGNRSLTAHKTSPRHTNAPPTTKKWRSGHVWPLKPHPTRHRLTRPAPPPSNSIYSVPCFIIKR